MTDPDRSPADTRSAAEALSPERRREVVSALRKGTVPQRGLEALAVGLDWFGPAVTDELADVAAGGAVFKAVRGEYGCGKSFFARWIQETAKQRLGSSAPMTGYSTRKVPSPSGSSPLRMADATASR